MNQTADEARYTRGLAKLTASTAEIMAEKLSCSSTTRGFCFTFEKIVERRREGSVLESRQNSFGLS